MPLTCLGALSFTAALAPTTAAGARCPVSATTPVPGHTAFNVGTERLAVALCTRALEQDLHGGQPVGKRTIFAFEPAADPAARDGFLPRFDVLHRTFLGYPAALADPRRVDRFFGLYRGTLARHAGEARAHDAAWTAVCVALARHPEFLLY